MIEWVGRGVLSRTPAVGSLGVPCDPREMAARAPCVSPGLTHCTTSTCAPHRCLHRRRRASLSASLAPGGGARQREAREAERERQRGRETPSVCILALFYRLHARPAPARAANLSAAPRRPLRPWPCCPARAPATPHKKEPITGQASVFRTHFASRWARSHRLSRMVPTRAVKAGWCMPVMTRAMEPRTPKLHAQV